MIRFVTNIFVCDYIVVRGIYPTVSGKEFK